MLKISRKTTDQISEGKSMENAQLLFTDKLAYIICLRPNKPSLLNMRWNDELIFFGLKF